MHGQGFLGELKLKGVFIARYGYDVFYLLLIYNTLMSISEKPPVGIAYGGYLFSEAQMEVVSGFSEDKLIKIGEIMVSGRKNHKRSYQIEQEYFNSMGWDGHFFVLLDSNKGFPELEERTMWDYFLGYEDFETEGEIRNFFEANEYLKKNLKMREGLINLKIEFL